MTNKSIDKAESKFVIHNAKCGANISITITNGELSYVAHWGTRSESTHDLEKHPNWEHAEFMLESICKYNREEFLNMAKLLKKDSKGYEIIKKIARSQLSNCDSEISKIMKEAEFWKSFQFFIFNLAQKQIILKIILELFAFKFW